MARRSKSHSSRMRYFSVKTAGNVVYAMGMHDSTTIPELKDELALRTDVPYNRQRLFFSGHPLKGNRRIADYDIESGNIVYLVLGAANSRSLPLSDVEANLVPTMVLHDTTAIATLATVDHASSNGRIVGSLSEPRFALNTAKYTGPIESSKDIVLAPSAGVSSGFFPFSWFYY